MAIFTTTVTFADNEQVTSARLNQIVSGLAFASGAITGTTLALVGGALKVGTITSSEMGVASVVAAALASDSVTTVKILDANVTTAKLADDAVTEDKLAAAAVVFASLKAAAVAIASEMVAQTASKLVPANLLKYHPAVAKAFCAYPIVTSSRTIVAQNNVASITRVDAGIDEVAFTTAMADANYVVVAGMSSGSSSSSSTSANPQVYDRTTAGFKIDHASESAGREISFVVYGTLVAP